MESKEDELPKVELKFTSIEEVKTIFDYESDEWKRRWDNIEDRVYEKMMHELDKAVVEKMNKNSESS